MTDSHNTKTQAGASMAPKLEVTQGEELGTQYKVALTTRIGREVDNDIVLTDTKISRYHAEIIMDNGAWTLIDLGSFNQTFLNGLPITKPMALEDGDRIGVGEIELTFALPHPAHPHDTIPITTVVPPRSTSNQFVTSQGSPSRLLWMAGLFVLLLMAVTVMVLYALSHRPTNETANTPVTAETEPVKLVVAYKDDFSDSQSGWDDVSDKNTRKVYGNNRYQIEVSTVNLVARGLASRDVTDFVVEVEAKQEDGDKENTYGLFFRFKDDLNFYRFDIASDGYYLLSKFLNGQWVTLVDWTKSEHFKLNEANLLKISAFGSKITASINGTKEAEVTDSSFTHGNFGFFASTFGKPYNWVSFDNLTLQVPEGTENTMILLPTATRPFAKLVTAPSATPTALPIVTLTPTSEIETTAEAKIAESPTPTTMPTLTPEQPTPVPLPEYASRSQPLARGEERVSGRIIFPMFDSKRGTYDIYLANAADGSDRKIIQKNGSQPACSVDGTDFAYRSWQGDQRGLFARSLSGEDGKDWRFTSFFEDSRPQFSPMDKSLMYYSRVGGKDSAVYRVINGVAEVMRRESAPIQGESAKWLPNGQQFVYHGCFGGSCGIIISNIDGSNPTLLTTEASDTSPEVSPDGSTIVFMSRRKSSWDVYRMDIDGKNITALTTDEANDGLPTWSPDGKYIAFVSDRDSKWGIWNIAADGSNNRLLFTLDGSVDGVIQLDPNNSRGWVEENIDWIP